MYPTAAMPLLNPTLQRYVNTDLGYYNESGNSCYGNGNMEFGSDNGIAACSHIWPISFSALARAAQFSYDLKNNPGEYNCYENNCTVETVAAAENAEITLCAGSTSGTCDWTPTGLCHWLNSL